MEGGSIVRGLSGRILKANLFTVVLFGVILLGIVLYFKAENDHADRIRFSADRMDLRLQESRIAEKDFMARDLTNPVFFEAALGRDRVDVPKTNLVAWEQRYGQLRGEIDSLLKLIGNSADFDRKTLKQLSDQSALYGDKFRALVAEFHRMGFKDWGLEGEWRKVVHELETAIKGMNDPSIMVALLQLRRDEKDFLLRGDAKYVEEMKKGLAELRGKLKAVAGQQGLVEKVDRYEKAFESYLLGRSRLGATHEEGIQGELRAAARAVDASAVEVLDQAVLVDERAMSRFPVMLGIGTLIGLLISGFVGAALGRQVARPITQLAATCQSAAAELQAAANQQATGTKEQATSMNEISTTINELLASSKQIADSARRVAQIAEHAGTAARSGDQTVQRSHESIGGIRRQVDLIVSHMTDLGKKSQQIGGVLEIINELSEQTNILAINATIEAAGGGESGKRFGVVADEIRKLADRVSGSTKEIQGLIEEVRGAVNATVMTTETGSKAVDAGAQQFGEVAAAFKQIVGLVGTNTEAGREIELTTKQQATAVEQVNAGVMSVGQATREMEASTAQTFQTASQLATVARELSKLVNASTNGHA